MSWYLPLAAAYPVALAAFVAGWRSMRADKEDRTP